MWMIIRILCKHVNEDLYLVPYYSSHTINLILQSSLLTIHLFTFCRPYIKSKIEIALNFRLVLRRFFAAIFVELFLLKNIQSQRQHNLARILPLSVQCFSALLISTLAVSWTHTHIVCISQRLLFCMPWTCCFMQQTWSGAIKVTGLHNKHMCRPSNTNFVFLSAIYQTFCF